MAQKLWRWRGLASTAAAGWLATSVVAQAPVPTPINPGNEVETPVVETTPSIAQLEEQYLLPLVNEEHRLLVDYGPQHPDVKAVRARIRVVLGYLEAQRAAQAAQAARPQPVEVRPAPSTPPRELPPMQDVGVVPAVHVAPAVSTPGAESTGLAETRQTVTVEVKPIVLPEMHYSQNREQKTESSSSLNQTLLLAGALVTGLGLHLLGLIYFVRRSSQRLAEAVEKELANRQMALVASQPAPIVPAPVVVSAEVPAASEPEPAPPEIESTAQPFDIGPSYEEERRAREEAEQQKEEALLRHIFELNVKLRQQIAATQTP